MRCSTSSDFVSAHSVHRDGDATRCAQRWPSLGAMLYLVTEVSFAEFSGSERHFCTKHSKTANRRPTNAPQHGGLRSLNASNREHCHSRVASIALGSSGAAAMILRAPASAEVRRAVCRATSAHPAKSEQKTIASL